MDGHYILRSRNVMGPQWAGAVSEAQWQIRDSGANSAAAQVVILGGLLMVLHSGLTPSLVLGTL